MKKISLSVIFVLLFSFVMINALTSCGDTSSVDLPSSPLEVDLDFRGVDISFYDQITTLGGTYKYQNKDFDFLDILKSANVNWVRLRLWVDPQDEWCNLEHTIKIAKKAKQNGFKFLLDFHYSDTWADPAQQTIPQSWENLIESDESTTVTNLATKIKEYTESVLNEFIAQDVKPDMVQTGNEITNGMLWPYGTTEGGDCTNLMLFLSKATTAVREKLPEATIMLHLDRGGDNTIASWWFGEAEKAKIDYDIIGLSYYPFFHGTDLEIVKENLISLKNAFNKDVCIVETSYPWTNGYKDDTQNQIGEGADLISGYPATIEGQKGYLKKLSQTVKEAKGKGVFYWGADSICVSGYQNALENQAWFDFDNNWTGIKF